MTVKKINDTNNDSSDCLVSSLVQTWNIAEATSSIAGYIKIGYIVQAFFTHWIYKLWSSPCSLE